MDKKPTTYRSPLILQPVPLRNLVTPSTSSWLPPPPPPPPLRNEFDYVLAEQFNQTPENFFQPAPGEHVTSDSPCKCGTWYFPTLPASLGGCGHIYRVVRHACNGSAFFTCPGTEWTSTIRSANYILGLCPTCERNQDPQQIENHRSLLNALAGKGPDAFERMINFYTRVQLFFDEEQRRATGCNIRIWPI
jgi:hypothetical protein